MNEETKTNLFKFWKEIVIVLLIIVFIVTHWIQHKKQLKLQEEINRRDAALVTGEINAGIKPVNDRETTVYPKIDADVAALNKIIKESRAKTIKLENSKPTKEQSYETFKNQSSSQISKFFRDNGYPNAVIRTGSGK